MGEGPNRRAGATVMSSHMGPIARCQQYFRGAGRGLTSPEQLGTFWGIFAMCGIIHCLSLKPSMQRLGFCIRGLEENMYLLLPCSECQRWEAMKYKYPVSELKEIFQVSIADLRTFYF